MNDKIDDEDSLAPTLKPGPRISQKPTIPAQPIISTPLARQKSNVDIIGICGFAIFLLIAIILYIYVNHPFKDPGYNYKTIYNSEPVLITAPIKPAEVPIIPEEKKIEPAITPITSSQIHIIKKPKVENDSKDKDYGI
jgi:hypothetical protein